METKLNVTKDIQAKVWEFYSKGLTQKDVIRELGITERAVAHCYLLFTATYGQQRISREVQLKALEDNLFKELEINPNSNLCYQLEQQYCTFLLK